LPPQLCNLKSLQSLLLAHNALRALPAEMGNMPALSVLDLTHNNFVSLPNELGNLSETLTVLKIGENKLTDIFDSLGKLSHLIELDVRDNGQLACVPGLGYLTSLQRLCLRNLQLKTVSGLECLSNLVELDLTDNSLIKCIPNEIGYLYGLKKMDLYGCGIQQIPDFIGGLQQLTHLDLRNNLIPNEGIPASFANLLKCIDSSCLTIL